MKTAIVTGSSTGIGRATSIVLAKKGYHVILVARTKNGLEETQKLIDRDGGSSEIFVVDLSDLDSVNSFIYETPRTPLRSARGI